MSTWEEIKKVSDSIVERFGTLKPPAKPKSKPTGVKSKPKAKPKSKEPVIEEVQ